MVIPFSQTIHLVWCNWWVLVGSGQSFFRNYWTLIKCHNKSGQTLFAPNNQQQTNNNLLVTPLEDKSKIFWNQISSSSEYVTDKSCNKWSACKDLLLLLVYPAWASTKAWLNKQPMCLLLLLLLAPKDNSLWFRSTPKILISQSSQSENSSCIDSFKN